MVWTCCRFFILIALLTGGIYPLIVTTVATVTMPDQAHGSLIFEHGKLKGSKLIAQPFNQNHYFWPRPSTRNYNPLISYGSNLGPTSRKLQLLVKQREQKYLQSSLTNQSIPSELVYASGSGLDPHISVEGAYFQIERIARARSLNREEKEELIHLIDQFKEGDPELLGPRYVNVLLINIALDQHFSNFKHS